MKKLLVTFAAAIGLAAGALAATLNLSTVTANTTIPDGTTVTGTLGSNVKLTIPHGATVTLSGATINGGEVNSSSYKWAGLTCDGNATIILVGESTVNSFCDKYPGIYVPELRTLTIQGSGTLNAKGCARAAGIGGGLGTTLDYLGNCGTIVINGGEIMATGGDGGAGIGGGQSSICTSIVINGGEIRATGGTGGAGIGGGRAGSCGSIAIKGGEVESVGGSNGGAGIGSGYAGRCGVIMFGDGYFAVMAATTGGTALTIGAGTGGSCDAVMDKDTISEEYYGDYNVRMLIPKTINLANVTEDIDVCDGQVITGTLAANVRVCIDDGATVTLRDVTINGVNNSKWAGITCDGDATIILEGKNTVKGFYNEYPGIYVPVGWTLTIRGDGSLDASSNGYAAGIGGGYKMDCGNIVIEGGTITAKGGFSAGIGGGYYAACGNITITGGTIQATGSSYASGIGCGNGAYARCGDITITKGVASVTATKGPNATYSIGAGYNGTCGTVKIGGVVGMIKSSPYTYPSPASVVELSGLSGNYKAKDGDVLRGETEYSVTIPGGVTVTVNGVTITGAAGGTMIPESAFVFDANGGKFSNGATVKKTDATPGNLWGKMYMPAKDGQVFVGWYTAKEGGELVTSSSTVPYYYCTYYAHWTPRLGLAAASEWPYEFTTENWCGQGAVAYDGKDALRSGIVYDGQNSYLQTRVTGPGTLTFWWAVSCEGGGNDALRLLVDGSQVKMITGDIGWTKVTVPISGSGTHVIKWNYTKNGSVTKGEDFGWLDQMTWTAK